MPRIQVDPSCLVEDSYFLPSSHLENMYAEAADPRYGWPYRMIPTPGLSAFSDYTAGTIGRGCFQSDVISSGDIIAVYATDVRKTNSAGVTTLITGAVSNDSKAIAFALSQTQAVIVSGGVPYTVTGSAVTSIAAALTGAGASGAIIDVAVVNNRFLYAEDNSGRVFYSDPGAAGTISGFFTAERDPDQIVGLLVVGSTLLAMGKRRIEGWTGTDSATIPFIQRNGFVFAGGLIGSRARTELNDVGYWVGSNHHVLAYRSGVPVNIAPPWLTRLIASLSAANKELISLSSHFWRGHEFVHVYLPGKGSFFYDSVEGTWHRRRDLGDELVKMWSYNYFVEGFGATYCQNVTTGRLYKLDDAVFTENGVACRRVMTFMLPVKEQTRISNIIIEGQAGVGLDGSGVDENDNPKAMLRVSPDGHTFGDELTAETGRHAQYRWRPVFGAQGTLLPPIAKVELAYSAAVGWTVYGASYNERVA